VHRSDGLWGKEAFNETTRYVEEDGVRPWGSDFFERAESFAMEVGGREPVAEW